MVDDRNKPRRAASFWGDEQRAVGGRKRTEPGAGVPVEVDDEATPPPTDIREAVGQLWELRHLGERLQGAERAIRGYTGQVDRHEERLDQWVDQTQKCAARIDHATRQLTELSAHMEAFFERDWKRITESLDGVSRALQDLGQRLSRLEVNVNHVDTEQTEQAAKLIALDTRVTKLERVELDKVVVAAERKRWLSWGKAAWAAVVAAIGTAGYLAGSQL